MPFQRGNKIGSGWKVPVLLSGAALPLDSVSNVVAAYSFRKLRTAYAGSAVRIRRSSDNAEQDFGFVGNQFDTAGAATFIGGGSGLIVTRYDQSGNGADITMATSTKQPLYAASSINSRPAADFDGTDDELTNTATSLVSANSAYTVLTVAKSDVAGGGALLAIRLTNTFSSSIVVEITGTDYVHGDGVNAAANITIADSAFKESPFVMVHRFTGSSAAPTIFVNGASRAVTGGTIQGTESGTTGFRQGGNTAAAAQYWNGPISEQIVLSTAISASDRAFLEANMNAYYALY